MALGIASLVYAAELALIALSFSLSYRVVNFANFAHVEFVTIGGLTAYTLSKVVPLPVALVLAAVVSGAVAVGLDLVVFRRLERAGRASKMIASAGIAIALRAVIQFIWGVRPLTFERSAAAFRVAGVRVTLIQVAVIVVAVLSVVLFHVVLTRTQFGRSLRATADNRSLVEIRGVDSRKVISQSWFVSGAMAGLAGMLLGMETFVQAPMGQMVLLPMFGAALVGGFGSPYGAIAGALLLSIGQTAIVSINFGELLGFGSFYLGSHYKSIFAFCVIVVVLLIRPGGFFGQEEARA